jgi:hypothetical protein
MKKQSVAEAKAKHASPTKRKWNSKVADLLVKTLDRYEALVGESAHDAPSKTAASFEQIDSLLKQTASLVSVSDVDNLIDEAAILTIPAHNDNLKKLHELKGLAAELEKEAEKLSDKKADRKIGRYFSLLKRVVNTGMAISHLEPIEGFLKRNAPLLQVVEEGGVLSSLTTLLEEAEKNPKLYDADLVDNLAKKKDKYRKVVSKVDEFLKIPQVCLIDESALNKIIKELKDQKFEFEGKDKIFTLAELVKQIRDLARSVLSSGRRSTIENELDEQDELAQEELSDIVQRGTFKLKDMLEEDIDAQLVTHLESKAEKIKASVEKLALDDPELSSFLGKLEAVVWRHKAKEVLGRNEENEDELVKLLQDTPKEVAAEGCREYSQIKERVHAIQAAQSNEKRIVDRLELYWEDEQLHLKIPEIRAFVEETKSYILKKKIERKLEVLEQVAVALQNVSSAKNKEDLVDEMSDLRLQGTKVFQKLSAIAKASEKAEKQVAWIRLNKKKLQKYRESALTPSVRVLIDMPRMKLSQAKEIMTFLKGLPQALRTEYDEDIKGLDAELHSIHNVGQEAESLLKQFPRQKFLDAKYTPEEARSCVERLRVIVNKLFESNYKDEAIESKLSELDLLVRSAALLDKSIDPTLKRDILSWENTHKALKEWSKDDQKNGLTKNILVMLKKAEKIMMEVHRMRQYESQFAQAGSKTLTSKLVTRQNKMLSLPEAKSLLQSYEEGCQEIELDDTSNYLRTLVKSCEERMALASNPNSSISDLITIQEQIKKTPLNLESLTAELTEKITKAQEFVKRVKGLSSETLAAEMTQLKEDYSKLGVKVTEFEKLSEQFTTERERCRIIEEKLERYTLQDLMRYRQELMTHSFFRDRNLETKMLLKQVQLLEEEFIKASEGFDDEIDTPLLDLITLETLQKELLEVRKNSRFNYSNKGQFMGKLISDVKAYLQENVYSMDLDGVSKLKSHCYKKLVDLTKEITDHKIKLEISQKPLEKNPRKKETEETRKYDAFGLFGSDFALVSRQEPLVQHREDRVHPSSSHMDVEDIRAGKATVGGNHPADADASEGRNKDGTKKRRHDGTYHDPKKPEVVQGPISSQLKDYFIQSFKYWLERNDNFEISGLDALMEAKALEKHICDKYLDKAKDYDDVCESICKVLRNLATMKYLSIYIRNKGFRLSILLRLTDKDRSEIRKIDTVAKQKLDKNKGKTEDNEIRVVDEEDELLENIGEVKPREEANLHFSDSEGGADPTDEIPVPKPSSHPLRALCYDPETGQYELVNNKFVPSVKGPEYAFYNIFKGGIFFETKDKPDPKKKPERTKLFACVGDEFIKLFTEIPEGLIIQPSLTRFEFEQYMHKVLVSDQALDNYFVMPIWVDVASPLTIKNFYKSHECVGTAQYSNKCKIFIFPKEYLKQEWLNVINFIFIKKDMTTVELLGFVVHKRNSSDAYEMSIIPEPVRVEKTHKTFKFARNHSDVVEKIMDIDLLRQDRPPEDVDLPVKESSRFFEDIVETMPPHEERNRKIKPMSKLQRLMNNEISTTQSPHRRGNRDSSLHDDSNNDMGQGMRGHGGRQGMGMMGSGRKDDMESEGEKLSRISSDEEVDDQLLGKRYQQGMKGPMQSMPPHIAPDYGQQGGRGYKPMNQGGYQGRGGPGGNKFGEQRGMDHGMNQYGQSGPNQMGGMGMPNKMIKRDFNQSGNPRGMGGPQKPYQYGGNTGGGGGAAMSNFDMSTMGDSEPPSFPPQRQMNAPSQNMQGGYGQQRPQGNNYQSFNQGQSGMQGQHMGTGGGHPGMSVSHMGGRQGQSGPGGMYNNQRDNNNPGMRGDRQDNRPMRGGYGNKFGGGPGGPGGDRGNNMGGGGMGMGGGGGNRYNSNPSQGQPQQHGGMGYHPGGGQRNSYQPQMEHGGNNYGSSQFGGQQGGFQGNRMMGGNKPMGGGGMNYQSMGGQGGHRQNDFME